MKEARHKAVETLFDIKDKTRISANLWNPHALAVLDLADQYDRLREALRFIVDETCEYAIINKLGDPEQQHSIKLARSALGEGK